jgi:hypothetical protein
MFEYNVSKDMKKNKRKRKVKKIKRRIPTYLLENLLALIIKESKISVEQGRVVTTSNNMCITCLT